MHRKMRSGEGWQSVPILLAEAALSVDYIFREACFTGLTDQVGPGGGE